MGTLGLLSSTTMLEPSSKRLGGGERIRVAAGHFMLDGGSLLFAVEKRSEVGLAVPSLRRASRLRSWAGRLVCIDRIGTLMLHEAHGEIGLGVGLVSECYP